MGRYPRLERWGAQRLPDDAAELVFRLKLRLLLVAQADVGSVGKFVAVVSRRGVIARSPDLVRR